MNIKKFKKEMPKEQYILVINYYDCFSDIDESQYILFDNYNEATNFLCWSYNLDKSLIIEENITNPKKYGNDQREENDYEFELDSEYDNASIYDELHGRYIEIFSIEKINRSSFYFSKGYDTNIDYRKLGSDS